jgi:hypothetical protein
MVSFTPWSLYSQGRTPSTHRILGWVGSRAGLDTAVVVNRGISDVSIAQFNCGVCHFSKSRDSSVSIALGYGLDGHGSKVRLLAGAVNFSLHHRVQNGSGAHPASYPMGTRGSFPGGKPAGV